MTNHDLDYEPAPTEYSLQQARWYLDRLMGVDVTRNLESVESDGYCDECINPSWTRYRYGAYSLCRRCVTHRLEARKRAETW